MESRPRTSCPVAFGRTRVAASARNRKKGNVFKNWPCRRPVAGALPGLGSKWCPVEPDFEQVRLASCWACWAPPIGPPKVFGHNPAPPPPTLYKDPRAFNLVLLSFSFPTFLSRSERLLPAKVWSYQPGASLPFVPSLLAPCPFTISFKTLFFLYFASPSFFPTRADLGLPHWD